MVAAFGSGEDAVRTVITRLYKRIEEQLPSDDVTLLTDSELDYCVEMAIDYAKAVQISIDDTNLPGPGYMR